MGWGRGWGRGLGEWSGEGGVGWGKGVGERRGEWDGEGSGVGSGMDGGVGWGGGSKGEGRRVSQTRPPAPSSVLIQKNRRIKLLSPLNMARYFTSGGRWMCRSMWLFKTGLWVIMGCGLVCRSTFFPV